MEIGGRGKYSPGFKRKAVEPARQSSQTIADVRRDTGSGTPLRLE